MVRVKNRYITFKILYPPSPKDTPYNDEPIPQLEILKSSSPSINQKSLAAIFRDHLQVNFGEFAQGTIAPVLSVRYFSNRTSTGIVKVGRDDVEMVCFAMMCIQKLYGQEVVVSIVRISGTIKKAQDFLIGENKELVNEIRDITG
ncbi:RNA-binding protein [Saccharomycopsis crataegensis]|uniref:Ribonuclease P/MRP protein subunit POP5 n=1 Tax=Saccharomycopsis crataegensis TaxID=43959 RepID=A0AAV5QMX6_9ASCO|nr:RNA-binding protein [Saccharomycopsis crataegensis]